MLPSAKGLSFTFMYLLLCKESKFSFYSFLFFSFGKHHVVRKDLGTYVQLNMGSMSYYCWHHPWGEYVGRQNYKPLSFYVSGWNVLLMCMRWVLAIIEDYMMVEYVELLLRLCWILLEIPLLMAHLIWPLMAHHWCAIDSTPLVIFTNGAPPGAPLVSGILMAHHLVRH